jgi:hypothetical protein
MVHPERHGRLGPSAVPGADVLPQPLGFAVAFRSSFAVALSLSQALGVTFLVAFAQLIAFGLTVALVDSQALAVVFTVVLPLAVAIPSRSLAIAIALVVSLAELPASGLAVPFAFFAAAVS